MTQSPTSSRLKPLLELTAGRQSRPKQAQKPSPHISPPADRRSAWSGGQSLCCAILLRAKPSAAISAARSAGLSSTGRQAHPPCPSGRLDVSYAFAVFQSMRPQRDWRLGSLATRRGEKRGLAKPLLERRWDSELVKRSPEVENLASGGPARGSRFRRVFTGAAWHQGVARARYPVERIANALRGMEE